MLEGIVFVNTFYQMLDRAPKGRDEEALLRGEGEWWVTPPRRVREPRE